MRFILPMSLLCGALALTGGCAVGPGLLAAFAGLSAAGSMFNGLGKDAEVAGQFYRWDSDRDDARAAAAKPKQPVHAVVDNPGANGQVIPAAAAVVAPSK